MSEFEGVKATAQKNPVVKWVKKNPAIAAGIVGGAVLLVILFKPKSQPQPENSDPMAGSYYPEMPGAGGGGGADYSGDISNLYTELEGLYDAVGSITADNAAMLDSALGDMYGQLDSALGSIYGELDSMAGMQLPQPIQQIPYQQINPLTGLPITNINQVLSGIRRLDLNIPEPETFDIRSRMDAVGDRWGQLQAASGGSINFEMLDLHADNLLSAARIGGTYNPSAGTYSWGTQPVTRFRSDLVLTGNTAQDEAKARIASIGEQWGAADAATRENLNARAREIAAGAGGTYNPSTGTYTWN
ncbi:MAG: hypothetical protein M0P69_21890 [Bacteroidales bacterium]|nr:hypothetical protein [Bacteroidales bacterium]